MTLNLNKLKFPLAAWLFGQSAAKVYAQGYHLLEPSILPGGGQPTGLAGYLSGIFTTTLTVAAVLAVLMIVIGGLRYIMSVVPGQKEAGKKQIYAAIGGLLLALGSYLILATINPQLVGFEFLNTLTKLQGQIPDATTKRPPEIILPPGSKKGNYCYKYKPNSRAREETVCGFNLIGECTAASARCVSPCSVTQVCFQLSE